MLQPQGGSASRGNNNEYKYEENSRDSRTYHNDDYSNHHHPSTHNHPSDTQMIYDGNTSHPPLHPPLPPPPRPPRPSPTDSITGKVDFLSELITKVPRNDMVADDGPTAITRQAVTRDQSQDQGQGSEIRARYCIEKEKDLFMQKLTHYILIINTSPLLIPFISYHLSLISPISYQRSPSIPLVFSYPSFPFPLPSPLLFLLISSTQHFPLLFSSLLVVLQLPRIRPLPSFAYGQQRVIVIVLPQYCYPSQRSTIS